MVKFGLFRKTNELMYLEIIFTCLLGLASAVAEAQTTVLAVPDDALVVTGQRRVCGALVPGVCLWTEDAVTVAQRQVFEEGLNRVARELPAFSVLPARWAVWVSPRWRASAGYWSPDQRLSDGTPYLLFRQGILDSVDGFTRALAHEAMHAVHHTFQPRSANWIREGVALLAEYRVMGRPPGSIFAAQSTPAPLTGALNLDIETPEAGAGISMTLLQARYGTLFLYFHYVDRACGGGWLLPQILSAVAASAEPYDVSQWDAFLRRYGSGPCRDGFAASLRAFSWARFAPDYAQEDGYVWLFSALPALAIPAQWQAFPADAAYGVSVPRAAHGCVGQESELPESFEFPEGRCLRVSLPAVTEAARPRARRTRRRR